MYKILIWIGVVTASMSVRAQKKCDLKVKKDDFISEVQIQTQDVILEKAIFGRKSGTLWFNFLYFNKELKLVLPYATTEFDGSAQGIATFSIKFADGTIIRKTEATHSAEWTNNTGMNGITTFFIMSKADLEKFASSPIEKFKVEFSYSVKVIEREAKRKEEIQNNAACLCKYP